MIKKSTQSGFALLLAIVLASILIAIGLTILTITTKQLTLSSYGRESEIAFHAANAGMECVRFHRRENVSSQYTNAVTSSGNGPVIRCFNELSSDSDQVGLESSEFSNSDGYINHFEYRFDWGGSGTPRCSEVDLFVMVANNGSGDDITFDFDSYTNGVLEDKDCPDGSTCSVAISRGYNKSCVDLNNGLATVQREITAQF